METNNPKKSARLEVSSPSSDKISAMVSVYKQEVNIFPFLARTEAVFAKMRKASETIFTLDTSRMERKKSL